MTLGFRAEDAQIVPKGGQVAAPVYSMELLGEASLVTIQAGGALVAIKAAKDYRAEISSPAQASVAASICHLFNTTTGERIST